MSTPLLSLFFILLGFARPEPAPVPFEGLVGPALRSSATATESFAVERGAPVPALDEVSAFYEHRGYSPAWVRETVLTPLGEELLAMWRTSRLTGREPDEYLSPELESRIAAYCNATDGDRIQRAIEAARVDRALTASFILYARHRAIGRIDPRTVAPDWPAADLPSGFIEELADRLESVGPRLAVESAEPGHPLYRGLRAALREYREIDAAGGWTPIPDGPELSLGSTGPRVGALRERLGSQVAGPDSAEFDRGLKSALEVFQGRHGLTVSGRLDRSTLAALNVPVEARIRQIQLSMERARWFPADLGPRYIFVNIPEAVLRVVERDSVVLVSRAVVGKANRQTPMLVKSMTHVVLNPWWNLPPVVVDEDVLPELEKNTEYLKKKNIRVYRGWGKGAVEVAPDSVQWTGWTSRTMPYNFRMEPGPTNALGRVKFLFPNDEDVYIHDSPQRSLFRREQRLQSSGCVRVERARDLAAYLLTGSPGWDGDHLTEAFASREECTVRLRQRLPVYLVYLTAWVGEDGAVHFRPDLYGRDDVLAAILAGGAGPS